MEVIAMTHPDIAAAVAAARREDMLRLAARTHVVVTRKGGQRRRRLVAWLDAQRLRRRRTPAARPTCAAVTR